MHVMLDLEPMGIGKCPKCGAEPFQVFNLGCTAKCHVCGTVFRV
jgi:uncharacterized Zn-finger protein